MIGRGWVALVASPPRCRDCAWRLLFPVMVEEDYMNRSTGMRTQEAMSVAGSCRDEECERKGREAENRSRLEGRAERRGIVGGAEGRRENRVRRRDPSGARGCERAKRPSERQRHVLDPPSCSHYS